MIITSKKGGAYYTISFFAIGGAIGLLAGIVGFLVPVWVEGGDRWIRHTGAGAATLTIAGLIGGLFWLPFFIVLRRNVKNIVIDTGNRTMSFSKVFSKKQEVYSFDAFNGYTYTYQPVSFYVNGDLWRVGDPIKILCLLDAGIGEQEISSAYYSNFAELEKALQFLPYVES